MQTDFYFLFLLVGAGITKRSHLHRAGNYRVRMFCFFHVKPTSFHRLKKSIIKKEKFHRRAIFVKK